MATSKQIRASYFEFIGRKVVGKFGGSYQNYDTMGQTWRQMLPYKPEIEEYIIVQTKLFLRLLNDYEQRDFNLLYNLCGGIADHLSKYLIKKSPDLTRQVVTAQVLDNILFNFNVFVANFKRRYKRPIDESDTRFVAANPGVMAMYNAMKSKQR